MPNHSYSGPNKPKLAEFQEVPFTTEAAEYNVLQAAAAGGQKLDVGYLPTTDAPAKPANATVGTNPVHNFTLDPLYAWGINYFPVNYQSHHGQRPDHQAALLPPGARLPDEPGVDHQGPLRGYGLYTVGPVGTTRRPSSCRPGQAGRPVPVQPDQGQGTADQPRLERRQQRQHHLHEPAAVRHRA